MKKAKIDIEGMHCASCASNTEKSLKKTKGVINASVNIIAKKGFVETENDVTEEDLKNAVKRAGYKAVKIEFYDDKQMMHEMDHSMAEHEKIQHDEHKNHDNHDHSGVIEDISMPVPISNPAQVEVLGKISICQ